MSAPGKDGNHRALGECRDCPKPCGEADGQPALAVTPAVSRRRFVDWILGVSGAGFMAAVLYPVVRFLVPPTIAEAAVNSVVVPFRPADMPPNSGRTFKFGSQAGLLVRTRSGELRAFSGRCTHLDCTVQYRDDLEHIWCACHNGHYDLNGMNISGPPPTPLPIYTVNERGDQIVVSRNA
ncbi:MAG: Rieske (2Fe-2S) protein [Gemmatimonadota bacterium]